MKTAVFVLENTIIVVYYYFHSVLMNEHVLSSFSFQNKKICMSICSNTKREKKRNIN